jgi:rhodanese-related sulfurtransferase
MVAVLFTATVLGIVFNSSNPLGPSFRNGGLDSNALPNNYSPAFPSHLTSGQPTVSPTDPVQPMRWAEVKALQESGGVVIIDVRAAAQFQADHIPDAISIPADSSDAELKTKLAAYSKSQPVLVYCASASCHLSRSFGQRLSALGFTRVNTLAGGLEEYLQAEKGRSQ